MPTLLDLILALTKQGLDVSFRQDPDDDAILVRVQERAEGGFLVDLFVACRDLQHAREDMLVDVLQKVQREIEVKRPKAGSPDR